ncbi:hypothetical protein EYS42_12895 [Aquabacterium lacunae]|uniref:Uncharacterized protein n=1 Tax=Aquabacterium lacunae TaxID=2528630 RepID=A0A4Q9H2J8_9BURK|nr:hypothetical protein EYS42_12895 [Aquabacterium lacunae]
MAVLFREASETCQKLPPLRGLHRRIALTISSNAVTEKNGHVVVDWRESHSFSNPIKSAKGNAHLSTAANTMQARSSVTSACFAADAYPSSKLICLAWSNIATASSGEQRSAASILTQLLAS